MKKSTLLMILWGIVVVILIGLLTTMGFIVGRRSKDYKELEEKIALKVKNSNIDLNRLNSEGLIITKEEMLDLNIIDTNDMTVKNDNCDGYVKITYDKVYKYKTYLKCSRYNTN